MHLHRSPEIYVYQDGTTGYVSADIDPIKPLKGIITPLEYDNIDIVYYTITQTIPFDFEGDPPITYKSTSPETFDPNNIQMDETQPPWELYE